MPSSEGVLDLHEWLRNDGEVLLGDAAARVLDEDRATAPWVGLG